eukprot:4267984-Pleurochrysis_carterae.AAC.6
MAYGIVYKPNLCRCRVVWGRCGVDAQASALARAYKSQEVLDISWVMRPRGNALREALRAIYSPGAQPGPFARQTSHEAARRQ